MKSFLPNMTGRGFGRTILGASRSPVIRCGLRGRRAYSFAAEHPRQSTPHVIIARLQWRSGAARYAARLTAPSAPGRRGIPAGLLNFCGALRHWSFLRSLLQLRQKSRSGFAQTLHASCVAPACHEQKHDTGATHELGSIVQERGILSQGGTHV